MKDHVVVDTWGRVSYPISVSVHGLNGQAKIFLTAAEAHDLIGELKAALKRVEQ